MRAGGVVHHRDVYVHEAINLLGAFDAETSARHVAVDRNCTLGAVGDWSFALHDEQFRERCKINV